MYYQNTFIFSKEKHRTILSMHFTKFCKSEKMKKNNNNNKKKKKLTFVNENYIYTS